MAETDDIWNDSDGTEEPKKKKIFNGWILSILVLLLLIAAIVFAWRQGYGPDTVRRWLHYGSAVSTGEQVYDYDASTMNRFALTGENLVVLSERQLQMLSADGEAVWSENISMKTPALQSAGNSVVAYDVGGTVLYRLNEEGLVAKITADSSEPIISATVNEDGWLALTTQKQNYKACVSVYDPRMEKVFDFFSSRRFISDACVMGNGNGLAAVTLGQEDSLFVSNVVLYDLGKTDPYQEYTIIDGLTTAMCWSGKKLMILTDTGLCFNTVKGDSQTDYSFAGEYLREFDLHGDGFAAMLLNRYKSGSVGRVVTVNTSGEELGSLDVNEEVLAISAGGKYLAVLYADRLVVYRQDMTPVSSLNGLSDARNVWMLSDGSALLMTSESARRYVP